MAETGQVVNAKALAKLFNDLTERRVQQLAKDGIIPKAARGKYPLAASIKGYIAYLQKLAFGSDAIGTTPDYTAERIRLLKANADNAELDLKIKQEEYLPRDGVMFAWTKQIAAFRAKMLSMPTKLAAELTGVESRKEVEAIAKRMLWEALSELAETHGSSESDIRSAVGGSPDKPTAA